MNTEIICSLQLTDIKLTSRIRVDYKDLDSLALSIIRDGLIHPICVNQETMELVAGGRRYIAYTKIAAGEYLSELDYDPTNFQKIPTYLRKVESPAHATLLELEENLRREDMSWKEYVSGISAYHNLNRQLALKEREDWTQEQTGKLLNISQTNVSSILKVNEVLKKHADHPIQKASNFSEALQILVKERYDFAAKLKLSRLRSAAQPVSTPNFDLSFVKPAKLMSKLDEPSGDFPYSVLPTLVIPSPLLSCTSSVTTTTTTTTTTHR